MIFLKITKQIQINEVLIEFNSSNYRLQFTGTENTLLQQEQYIFYQTILSYKKLTLLQCFKNIFLKKITIC